jgi:hypothetical protein
MEPNKLSNFNVKFNTLLSLLFPSKLLNGILGEATLLFLIVG